MYWMFLVILPYTGRGNPLEELRTVRGHALWAQSATRWRHFPGSVLKCFVKVY